MYKHICIAFLGNAFQDSRVYNLKNSLEEDGCTVSVISFDWFDKEILNEENGIQVIKIKSKTVSSFLFYTDFAFKLIYYLLKSKADIYFAEDLYTLPFVTIIGKLKSAKVYYNSRELYAFIGGLTKRPVLQSIVRFIEGFFIKFADLVMTTGEMDSAFIEDYYHITNTLVIRNIPLYKEPSKIVDFREMFNIPKSHIIFLYQGILQGGRGIKQIIHAVSKLDNVSLVLLGDGEEKNNFIDFAKECKVDDRIHFAGTINQNELINYTAGGDIGVALIENISLSYYHALPNKLFEYIMAGLPVISSNLPQMEKIVNDYNVGITVGLDDTNELIESLKKIINDPNNLERYKNNTRIASKILNWQEEYNRAKIRLLRG